MRLGDERQLNQNTTLTEVIRLTPRSTSLFDDLGIDYACSGATTLRSAAAGVGLTSGELMTMVATGPPIGERDWHEARLSELTRFLANDHSYMLSDLLPRIRTSIGAAVECHGPLPLLRRMRELELTLAETLTAHAASEERDLFPIVESLEDAASSVAARAPHARISQRVLREVIEHEDLRDRVHTLRDLVNELLLDYELATLSLQLRTFQRHHHEHMHLENNVLYPRAIAIENELRHAGDPARIHG
jgi:regulator of cell morphogenesis and NO signaling